MTSIEMLKCFAINIVGTIFIITNPWAATSVYRRFVSNTSIPNGECLIFMGKAKDMAFLLVLQSLIFWLFILLQLQKHIALPHYIYWLDQPAYCIIDFYIFRWIVSSVSSEMMNLTLEFKGSLSSYIFWNIILCFSLITIIGWAWVIKYFFKWICKNIHGQLSFDYKGEVWEILWRSLVCLIGTVFIIPIPWVLRWFMSWNIAQIEVVTDNDEAVSVECAI